MMQFKKIDYLKSFVQVYYDIQDEYVQRMNKFIHSIKEYKIKIEKKFNNENTLVKKYFKLKYSQYQLIESQLKKNLHIFRIENNIEVRGLYDYQNQFQQKYLFDLNQQNVSLKNVIQRNNKSVDKFHEKSLHLWTSYGKQTSKLVKKNIEEKQYEFYNKINQELRNTTQLLNKILKDFNKTLTQDLNYTQKTFIIYCQQQVQQNFKLHIEHKVKNYTILNENSILIAYLNNMNFFYEYYFCKDKILFYQKKVQQYKVRYYAQKIKKFKQQVQINEDTIFLIIFALIFDFKIQPKRLKFYFSQLTEVQFKLLIFYLNLYIYYESKNLYLSEQNFGVLLEFIKKKYTKVDLNDMSKKDINMFIEVTFNFAQNVFSKTTQQLLCFNKNSLNQDEIQFDLQEQNKISYYQSLNTSQVFNSQILDYFQDQLKDDKDMIIQSCLLKAFSKKNVLKDIQQLKIYVQNVQENFCYKFQIDQYQLLVQIVLQQVLMNRNQIESILMIKNDIIKSEMNTKRINYYVSSEILSKIYKYQLETQKDQIKNVDTFLLLTKTQKLNNIFWLVYKKKFLTEHKQIIQLSVKIRNFIKYKIAKNQLLFGNLTKEKRIDYWLEYMSYIQEKQQEQKIIRYQISDEQLYQIQNDIHRTLNFQCNKNKLQSIILEFLSQKGNLEYFQGLNNIVAFLQFYLKEEEKIEITLNYLSQHFINDFFGKNLCIRLSFLNQVIYRLLKQQNYKLFVHWQRIDMSIEAIFSTFLISLFTSLTSVSCNTLEQLWDIFIVKKWKGLIQSALFLINQNEQELLQMSSNATLQFFSNLKTQSGINKLFSNTAFKKFVQDNPINKQYYKNFQKKFTFIEQYLRDSQQLI